MARHLYDMKELFVVDRISMPAAAREDGFREGLEEARRKIAMTKGREEEKLRVARAMILSRMEPFQAAAYTELPEEQLRRLIEEQLMEEEQ